jgi:hypothetical protein
VLTFLVSAYIGMCIDSISQVQVRIWQILLALVAGDNDSDCGQRRQTHKIVWYSTHYQSFTFCEH